MTLEQTVKKLLFKSPFYGIFIMGIQKQYDTTIPTACVCKSGINCQLKVNKTWWDALDDSHQVSVLLHEVMHLCFKHMLMFNEFPDKDRLNIAADCSVNSYIPDLQHEPYIYPARFNLPNAKGVKWYYENLPQDLSGFSNGMPDIDGWEDFDNLNDAETTLINKQIDYLAKNTVEHMKKSCGNIPNELQEYINGLFLKKPPVFNWKQYFRRLVGNSIISFIKSTRYRPSKRFPESPGLTLKYKPKVLVAIDTSGSVSNDELADFFTEVEHLYKSGVSVFIIEFDTRIHTKFEYKGKKTDILIGGRGGTNATEAFEYYKQHNDFSTFVIFTDGYLGLNLPKCKNVIWIISSNGKQDNYPGQTVYIPKINN